MKHDAFLNGGKTPPEILGLKAQIAANRRALERIDTLKSQALAGGWSADRARKALKAMIEEERAKVR
jgi:hypothetical protein